MSIYDIKVEDYQGNLTTLEAYKGKVLLIVNTASKCGFTPQLERLQLLYDEFNEEGLEILGFPCNQFLKQEPGTITEILDFCRSNYGVTFPIFAKLNVKGRNQSPLYKHLTDNSPVRNKKKVKWNFEKFLINRNGEIINRYLPKIDPIDIKDDIKALL
jgi:glutathione peroxidase